MRPVPHSATTFHTILRAGFCESGHVENNTTCSFFSVLLSSLLNYASLFSSSLPFSFPYFSSLRNTECSKHTQKKCLCFIYFVHIFLPFFSLSIFLLCRVLSGLNCYWLNNNMWHKKYMWFKYSANITVGSITLLSN